MPRNTQSTRSSYSNDVRYGQIQPQSNQYIDAFANFEPQSDPTIPYRAAAARNRVQAGMMSPTGGYATPQMLDARRNAAYRDIDEQSAMASRAGQFDVNQQRMGQLGSLAAMMAPRIVQTGSSGTGSQNTETGQNLFGNLLNLGMGAANLAMF
jgi:hypothetical protein